MMEEMKTVVLKESELEEKDESVDYNLIGNFALSSFSCNTKNAKSDKRFTTYKQKNADLPFSGINAARGFGEDYV